MELKEQKNEIEVLPNTVYNCLKHNGKEFSRKDLRKISNAINLSYKKKFGEEIEPEKIVQNEDGHIFMVYCYPENFRVEMQNIVIWFYRVKKIREKKHAKILLAAKLDKLKRTAPDEYEKELERIKVEQEQKKRNALRFKKNLAKKKYKQTDTGLKKDYKPYKKTYKPYKPQNNNLQTHTNNTANDANTSQ